MVDDGWGGAFAGTGLFRLPSLADAAVGGKARSLARLASFGLPVPRAFAIVSSPGAPIVQAAGPTPPAVLRTPADLAALDDARAALLRAPLSAPFVQGLPAALAALAPAGANDETDGARADEVTFAVRSSSALEDDARAAAPGVFDSVLRVPRAGVGEAVRAVLASALTPAAWAYVLRAGGQGAIAVLVHRFVAGDAHGAVVCEPTGGDARVQLDVQQGSLADGARAAIEAGARRAAQAGPVELEWVATGDAVTFLQLRPYARGRAPAGEVQVEAPEPGWVWDAAHNPTPLTPAQAGLVEWVDARCTLGFRQRVFGGYLFYRPTSLETPPGPPRALFQRLQADVDASLAALGPAPRLRDALALYTRGYQGLFGTVQPACAAARAALRDFLRAHAPAALDSWAALVETGVASAASRRRAAADAIAAAPDAAARAAAIDAYLEAFGDESARWDVAEPTLRERPEALLFIGRTAPAPSAPAAASRTDVSALALASAWPEVRRADFQARLAAAREASAVAEDDDALFARLQAVVRRALLALGARLVNEGRLSAAGDVFFLPLAVSQAIDETGESPEAPAVLAAAGRAAFGAASAHPPSPPVASRSSSLAVCGQHGAGGRAIGRVVLHPAPAAPGPAGPAVLVAATLLPTELPLLDAAALVVETGTPLGHVAAQARERGIPAVVGAAGACATLRAGQLVLVDGDRGLVIPLESPPTSRA